MKTTIRSLLFVLALGLLASCSMQKRQYLPGYDVTWKHAKHHAEQQQIAVKQDAPAATTGALGSAEALAVQAPASSSPKETAEAPAMADHHKPVPADHNKASHATSSKTPKSTASLLTSVKKNPVISIAIRKMKAVAGDGDTRVNGFAIAGMVCGIVALFAYYGAFVLGVLAVIFSAIALNKIRTSGERGRIMAIAGLICGIVAIAIVATIVTVAAM